MHTAPVVFDLDGTLVDSLQDLAASLNAVLARLHCAQHPVDTIRTMIGGGAQKLLERGLGPGNGHKLDEAMNYFRDDYAARMLENSKFFAGISNLLTSLRAEGRTWAVATNKPAAFTGPMLEGLRAPELGMTSWASGDEVPRKKPAADVIALAAERGGFHTVPPDHLTYVGDMPVDVACGRNYGAVTVGVTWGFDPSGVVQAGPDFVVDTAAELLAVLRARHQTVRAHQRP